MTRTDRHPLAAFARRQGWDEWALHAYATTIAALYREGFSTRAIAERLGLASRTATAGQLRALGVEMRRPSERRLPRGTCPRCGHEAPRGQTHCSAACARKHPKPTLRVCQLEGCDVAFLPQADKQARGAGNFCCPEHYYKWRSEKPERQPARDPKTGRWASSGPG